MSFARDASAIREYELNGGSRPLVQVTLGKWSSSMMLILTSKVDELAPKTVQGLVKDLKG
jgi:hypothetical protein